MSYVKAFFNEYGYYHAKGVFVPREVTRLEAEFDRIVQQLQDSGEDVNARWDGALMEKLQASDTVVVHTHNVQQYSGIWLQALLHEGFLHVAEEILGPDIVLHHTKLFQKPPGHGAPFPMHQDWEYFPTLSDTMIAGVIHVSEATDEMGCLRVYPGSHRDGRLRGTNGHADADYAARYPLEGAVPLEAAAGDVVFFHYFTCHGSLPNRSGRPRKTVLAQLHAGTDRVEPGVDHPNENLVLRGWNYHASRSLANT